MKMPITDDILALLAGITIFVLVLCGLGNSGTVSASAKEGYPDLYALPSTEQKPMESGTVYLTFDDGPSRNTDAIMEVLDKYNVKATFFVMGKNNEYIDKMTELAEKGHTVAPHTYSHDYNKIYSWVDAYLDDFSRIHELVEEKTGTKSSIYRFPGGSRNSTASPWARVAIIDEMNRRGFTYYDWNVVSGDDKPIVLSPQELLDNVLRQDKGQDSLVILFHDSYLYTTTPEGVELVIQHYTDKGYKFAPITAETQPIQFR